MSDKPLTERVQDAPTKLDMLASRVVGRVREFMMGYVMPPVMMISSVAIPVGGVAYEVHGRSTRNDLSYCDQQNVVLDPSRIEGPETGKSCAELFRSREEVRQRYNIAVNQ